MDILPVALIGIGGYLTWFAIHYWARGGWPTAPVKSVLTGQGIPAPAAAASVSLTADLQAEESGVSSAIQATDQGQGGSSASGPGASGGGSGATVPASASEQQWMTALLAAIGAPATSANLDSMISWAAHEEPASNWDHWNNPLNTTYSGFGGVAMNSVGVKAYPTLSDGLNATVATLTGGGYGDILMRLKAGQGLKSGASAGLLRWSGGGYSSV